VEERLARELKKMLERTGGSGSFMLKGGKKYTYDPGQAGREIYFHAGACARADYHHQPRPALPEVLKKLAKAKDREWAMRQFFPDVRLPLTVDNPGPFTAVCLNALVEKGEIVPRLMASSYPPVETGG